MESWLLYAGLLLIALLFFEIVWVLVHAFRAVRGGEQARPVHSVGEGGVRILVIGDSTAYGTGAIEQKNSLVGRLVQDYPSCTVINHSENAMDLRRLVAKLKELGGNKFDVVVMHVGGVDTLKLTTQDRIKALLLEAFACAKGMGAKTVTLVSVNNVASAKMFHAPLRYAFGRRSRKVSEISAAACAEAGVFHVPLYKERLHDPLRRNGVHFAADGIHPNDHGYGLWYAEIKQVVGPQLQKIITE